MLLLIIILLANLVITFPIGNSFVFPLESFAQIVLPKTVEPGRIPSRFKPYPVPKSKLAPLIPSSLGKDSVKELNQNKFLLSGVLVEGSTVYKDSDLYPLYKEFLGVEIDMGKIHEIANRITQKYREDGYVLSKAIVERQQVKSGIVKIRALEGHIDNIEIENATDLPDTP